MHFLLKIDKKIVLKGESKGVGQLSNGLRSSKGSEKSVLYVISIRSYVYSMRKRSRKLNAFKEF